MNEYQWFSELGPLGYPLLGCSLLALAIIIERCGVLLFYSLTKRLRARAIWVLEHNEGFSHSQREEVAALWLQQRRRALSGGIRILSSIATLAPLLGLLGTVIGLITVFDALDQHKGPIEPALLADGLGMAMKTTAAGLIISVPALAAAHGFQIWVERIINQVELAMNINLLEGQGITVEALQ